MTVPCYCGLVSLGPVGAGFIGLMPATHSHAAHHHPASHAFGLGIFHVFQHLVVVVQHGLPHVNIRLPACLLIGIADGGNVGLHLVKSGMHFLRIRLHGFDVFLAHRLHLLMPLCALARRYAVPAAFPLAPRLKIAGQTVL